MGENVNGVYGPQPTRVAVDVEKPELDNRLYRVIKLENGLEALLIHDPDTDRASAALDVNVGCYSDPLDMPGMAHAVEHMLFMGTKKFPVENAYQKYLSAHSGRSNAFTAATSTNFYFEVAASSESADGKDADTQIIPSIDKDGSPFYGALDRFAQFFIEPLFLEDTLDRELRAVDSENKKNLQNDIWRLSQLAKSLSNPKHPYNRFSTGNYKTLHDEPLARGVKIRDEFIKFYESHYSANRMKLTVLAKEDLDTLESWVYELFSPIVNKSLPQNRWDDIPLLDEDNLRSQIFAKPVLKQRWMNLIFLYRDESHLYKSQPSRYIGHLIGHEGPGSIFAYLKEKGWVSGLSAGSSVVCPGSGLFQVKTRFTEDGIKNYKEVAQTIFQYIGMLREISPQKWVVEELQQMSDIDFRFKPKQQASTTTSSLSKLLQQDFPREWVLSYPRKIREFNSEEITKSLSYLRPDNCRIMITSHDFPGDWNQKEKWYGTEYKCEAIPKVFQDKLERAFMSLPTDRPQELYLPHKNEFIPTNLEVERREVLEPSKAPKLIRNEENILAWWKKDDQFWVPKANFNIILRSNLPILTPRNRVICALYASLVDDALTEYSYNASLSGLEYTISSPGSLGITVRVTGYNDKMPILLEKVLTKMRNLEVKEDRFNIIKERITHSYENSCLTSPYLQIGDYSTWLSGQFGWINDHYLAEIGNITVDDVRTFYPELLRQMHIEVMGHGNLYKEDTLKMTHLVESIIKPFQLPLSQWAPKRSLVIPGGSNFVYKKLLEDPANVNNCIEYLLYVGDNSERALRAKLLTFAQLTDERAFNQLRTKEQLGYVVFRGATVHHSMWAAYRILVQSERSPDYLEVRINEFLSKFEKELENMSDEEFEKHKTSLINKRLLKNKNLNQESSAYWSHIKSNRFDYEQAFRDVDHIKPLTKADIQSFYKTFISPKSPTRAKLSVHLLARAKNTKSTEGQGLDQGGVAVDVSKTETVSAVDIADVTLWKAGLSVTKGAMPVKDLSEFEELESKL